MDAIYRHSSLHDRSDDELFAIVQEREVEPQGVEDRRVALSILFDRHHARVYGQCRRLLGDEDLAADLTQEIFLVLLEKSIRYESRHHFSSWLYVLTRNRCLNALRRLRKEESRDPISGWEEVDPTDPGREYLGNELAEVLHRTCRKELSAREQEVVHLRYFWGLKVKEIAEFLGLENISGARTHLATAHRKLRKVLRNRYGDDVLSEILDEV